jgi:hypothetical protein
MANALIEAWRRFSASAPMRPLTERRIVMQWRLAGRPIPPPPLVKHSIVKEYQRRFGARVLIETGTFAGDTIAAMLGRFDRIVSIELDRGWHDKAVARFRGRPDVTLLQGDSGARLPEVLATLDRPALFWLDAHYSGPITARGALDSPIAQELGAIRVHPVRGHVVLIDDMRDFSGTGGYPRADDLVALLRGWDPGATVEIADDILRWHPPVAAGRSSDHAGTA